MEFKRQIFNEEHNLFREAFNRFLQHEVLPYQEQWEAEGVTPRAVWKALGEQGFLVPSADEKYGGLGEKDFRYQAIMIEEMSYINECGLLIGLHNSLVAPYILDYGSDALKERVVPKIISGESILAVAMTEPDAGSDLSAMKTTAKLVDGNWVLNGQKTFISNGVNSDVIVVAAKTNPDNPHCMGLFVVERDDPGFKRGEKLKKIGMHAQDTTELYFEDVKVSPDNVLGDPNMGFRYLMEKLAVERLTLAVGSVASAQSAIEHTIRYVKERKAFGKPIAAFQNTQFKLAEAKSETEIGQIFVDRMIEDYNKGTLTPGQACAGKYWTTDLACKVVDECLQLFGGYGYMQEYPISKMYTNVRIGKIYAGTNEIMKSVVAREMGLSK